MPSEPRQLSDPNRRFPVAISMAPHRVTERETRILKQLTSASQNITDITVSNISQDSAIELARIVSAFEQLLHFGANYDTFCEVLNAVGHKMPTSLVRISIHLDENTWQRSFQPKPTRSDENPAEIDRAELFVNCLRKFLATAIKLREVFICGEGRLTHIHLLMHMNVEQRCWVSKALEILSQEPDTGPAKKMRFFYTLSSQAILVKLKRDAIRHGVWACLDRANLRRPDNQSRLGAHELKWDSRIGFVTVGGQKISQGVGGVQRLDVLGRFRG